MRRGGDDTWTGTNNLLLDTLLSQPVWRPGSSRLPPRTDEAPQSTAASQLSLVPCQPTAARAVVNHICTRLGGELLTPA